MLREMFLAGWFNYPQKEVPIQMVHVTICVAVGLVTSSLCKGEYAGCACQRSISRLVPFPA
jgi:hypothetical protein